MSLIKHQDIKNLTLEAIDRIRIEDIVFPKDLQVRIVHALRMVGINHLGTLKEKYIKSPDRYANAIPNLGKKSKQVIDNLLIYSYPDINKIEPKILYTFNRNDEEKICTQIAK